MARAIRPHRPQRAGRQSTIAARGADFAAITRLGTGLHVPTESGYPFRGPDAVALKRKYAQYDARAQAWIARALQEPWIKGRARGNTGTAPELVLAGRYLSLHYTLHVSLFFQEKRFVLGITGGRRATSRFVADIAILGHGGDLIFLPLDGAYFHLRTLAQRLDGERRDRALGQAGRVVPVPDFECLSAARLDGFLRRKQVP